MAGFDYQKVFDQYLRTVQIPDFEYYFSDDHTKLFYRYSNCVAGFDLPLVMANDKAKWKILADDQWKSRDLTAAEALLLDPAALKKMYYIGVKPNAEH
jgi:hypothetical protein